MDNIKIWADEVFDKIEKKLSRTAPAVGDTMFPYTTENGRFVNPYNDDWWTNGFWIGILWKMYLATDNEMYRKYAEKLEEKLDKVIEEFIFLNHDVGFMWLLSSVINHRITGDETAARRGLHMATVLAGRFNIAGNFIRAWNCAPDAEEHNAGWVIIDSMMNIPLLYWASKETNDPRFYNTATAHADTLLNYAIRPDGSVKHIMVFDPETGEYIKNITGQSYDVDGAWSRGQAWAIYGFTLSYIHTGKIEYLDAAKRIAHYFISAMPENNIPPCDFRSPKEPVYKDTTAGACAACGLIELSKLVPEGESDVYLSAAIKMLRAMEETCCDWSDSEDSILGMGTEAYHHGMKNVPIIYGDYFFIEAIMKLRGDKKDMLFW